MSINEKIHLDQPKSFAFTSENKSVIKTILLKYPKNRKASAVLPLLDIAQRQNNNWIPIKAIECIAKILDIDKMRVLEVATFYSMFNLKPVGKYFLQVCSTTPCMLRGSDEIIRCIKDKLNISSGETSKCKKFSILEVECLGACVNAPVVQVNDNYYEDLDYVSFSDLIDNLSNDQIPNHGTVIDRNFSEAKNGATTLKKIKTIMK